MRPLLLLAILFAFCGRPAIAGELRGTCGVTFDATSTLHDFAGTAACTPFALAVTDAAEGDAQLGDVTLSVPVAGMRTGIARRDRTMQEMFEAGRFPHIVGRLSGTPLAAARRRLHAAAEGGSDFPLLLRIRGHERPVAARVTRLVDSSRELSLTMEFPVSLAAFGLEAPIALGFIRVGDEVRVKVSVHLAPLPTPWQPEAPPVR